MYMEKETEMRFWLITDTHFNHADKMKEYCDRPDDYEKKIWDSLDKIPQTDILIHLGDITIGKDKDVHDKISQYRFRKWLVRGNHDRKSDTWYLTHGWDFVCESFDMEFRHLKLTFSHKPLADTGFDFNIHGHFHNSDFRKNEEDLANLYTHKHRLIALEYSGYAPLSLSSYIDKLRQQEYARRQKLETT